MTSGEFREMALGLEGVVEGAHMGHEDFRVGGKVFATLPRRPKWLAGEGELGMVKVWPDEQGELVGKWAGVFVPAAGAWGRAGCTLVELGRAEKRVVKRALRLAWAGVRESERGKARGPS